MIECMYMHFILQAFYNDGNDTTKQCNNTIIEIIFLKLTEKNTNTPTIHEGKHGRIQAYGIEDLKRCVLSKDQNEE